MRPATLTEVVERSSSDPDWDHHLREFLDAFYARHGDAAAQQATIRDDPGMTGIPEADAFLGGVGEHLARRWGLEVPLWVEQSGRFLGAPYFSPSDPTVRDRLLDASPVSFRRRSIFVGGEPLQRARFPYDAIDPEHDPRRRTRPGHRCDDLPNRERVNDRAKRLLHVVVGRCLPEAPEMVEVARRRIDELSNMRSEDRDAWRALLAQSITEIARRIRMPGEEMDRMRSTTPFVLPARFTTPEWRRRVWAVAARGVR